MRTSLSLERDLAKDITNFGKIIGEPLYAEWPNAGPKHSDIKIIYNDKSAWIEVKKDSNSQYGSCRFSFDGKSWSSPSKSPLAEFGKDLLKHSGDDFLNDFKLFLENLFKDKIPLFKIVDSLNAQIEKYNQSSSSLRRIRNFITLESLFRIKKLFFQQANFSFISSNEKIQNSGLCIPSGILDFYLKLKRKSQYILKQEFDEIGTLISLHYLFGKTEPVRYMQIEDNLYKMSLKNNFLKQFPILQKYKKYPKRTKSDLIFYKNIPILTVPGSFGIRIECRKNFYEIQSELKTKIGPKFLKPSKYSLLKNSSKSFPMFIPKKKFKIKHNSSYNFPYIE